MSKVDKKEPEQGTFDTIRFLVEIKKRMSDDAVWSLHRPLTPGDQQRMGKWPSGGLVHVAHAFFIEMLRRETYTMAISLLSTGKRPTDITKKDLEQAVRGHISEMVNRFISGACEDTLERVKKDKGLY